MADQDHRNQGGAQLLAPPSIPLVQGAADKVGVCQRPVVRQVTDRATGQVGSVAIPCGSTRARVCPACAERARRLRMQQCEEGWHLVHDPLPADAADIDGGTEDESEGDAGDNAPTVRRIRSTRRLSGFPDLPAVAAENRSVGRIFTDPQTGAEFRPSMFVTLTLPSYGRIAPGLGVPLDPDPYDYRRAALDALYFPRLVDRWWQNLRRCADFKVQYFASVEAQRRLAPHLHAAVRGAIPRATLRVWSPGRRTARCGGHRSTPFATTPPGATSCLPGIGRLAGTSTPRTVSCCRPGTRRSTRWSPTSPRSRCTW